MPQISYFYGIVIYIQFLDHNPPHIHAAYQSFKGQYSISTGELMAGKMPNKAHKLVQEWIELRRSDLEKVWSLAQEGKQVFPIQPLE
jgi:hypothetical protein